jgi:hypothetical protein
VAYAPAVRASFVLVPPAGAAIESQRLSPARRDVVGSLLKARTPSLLNAPSGLTAIGGIMVAGPYFNENVPFKNATPVINRVPGALAIQRLFDRIEWKSQTGDGALFAPRLRKSPEGTTARPTVILLGRADQSA